MVRREASREVATCSRLIARSCQSGRLQPATHCQAAGTRLQWVHVVPCRTPGADRASRARGPAELVDCAVRLLRLLDRPRDAPVLRPLVEREILWRLLGGEQGGRVRQIGLADSRLAQVSHAIRHLRERYAEAVSVDELAAL